MDYSKHFKTIGEDQKTQVRADQVPNSEGGWVWPVSDWKRLARFLILGSEGGTYYITEGQLTVENALAVKRCIATDGPRVVDEIVDVSVSGRSPKNDPCLFALAMCGAFGNDRTKRLAFEALPKVARIGTHIFHFVKFSEGFRGWGHALRTAVQRWYNNKEVDALALQVVKYRQRDGWAHRDLLRLSHPISPDYHHNILYKWIVDRDDEGEHHFQAVEDIKIVQGFELLQKAESVQDVAQLVQQYRLPWECVPTHLRGAEMWEAVLPHLGLTALIRNLGVMSRVGFLVKDRREVVGRICERITSAENIKSARLHPIQILAALATYGQGHGVRGSGEWAVVDEVVEALNFAFYLAFPNVESSGKRWVLGLDVSGSMSAGEVSGVAGLIPSMAAAAMSLVTYRTEPSARIMAFAHVTREIDLTRQDRLDDVMRKTSGISFGGTDCALPMRWALDKNIEADMFVVYTDSETWAGPIHPFKALKTYRQKTGIPAKLAVVAMTSNGFTIANPSDAGMLDVVGFDTGTPEVLSAFAKGVV